MKGKQYSIWIEVEQWAEGEYIKEIIALLFKIEGFKKQGITLLTYVLTSLNGAVDPTLYKKIIVMNRMGLHKKSVIIMIIKSR